MSDFEEVGSFTVKSGTIEVSDPCYEGGSGNHFKAKNGRWVGYVRRSDEGSWGERIAALRATHESFTGEIISGHDREAGVDSGQMSISDGESFHYLPHADYDRACKLTCSKESAGVVNDYAVVSSSGYGDGGYEVKVAKTRNGTLVGVEVVFIPEPLVCMECGCTFEPQQSYDESYCEDCYVDLYESDDCEGCGQRFPNDELDDGLCENCREECSNCGAVFDKVDIVDGICPDCKDAEDEEE